MEESKDQGINVREKAKQLVSLLKDDERLRNERARALKAKERFAQTASGFGSDTGLVHILRLLFSQIVRFEVVWVAVCFFAPVISFLVYYYFVNTRAFLNSVFLNINIVFGRPLNKGHVRS